MVRQVQPPAPRIIQNTVHQTVVHLHQTTHQHILNRLPAAGGGREVPMLIVRQTAPRPSDDGTIDSSRPALAARRMLRVLSADSAQRTLRPFYRGLFQEILDREREEYRSRPAQSLLLVQSVLGRHQTLTTLRRLYREASERLDGFILHSLAHRRYVRHVRQDQEKRFSHRYAGQERAVLEELRHPAARRVPPLPPPEPEPSHAPEGKIAGTLPPSGGVLRLSGADFQSLVRGVADALSRRNRLESMRRGGM